MKIADEEANQQEEDMKVNVYKAGHEEILGTHEISSTQSLKEVVSHYWKETEVTEENEKNFMNQVPAGNPFRFGDMVSGPIFIIEHTEAERLLHDRMRAFFVGQGKAAVTNKYAESLRNGGMFYGNGMSREFEGIAVVRIDDNETLESYGNEMARVKWVYFND